MWKKSLEKTKAFCIKKKKKERMNEDAKGAILYGIRGAF